MTIDVRHTDWQRARRWGREPLVLGRIDAQGSVEAFDKVMRLFSVFERRDETSGRITWEFRFYRLSLDADSINSIDAIIYKGATYEIEAKEKKERDPAHWLFVGVRYSGGNQG